MKKKKKNERNVVYHPRRRSIECVLVVMDSGCCLGVSCCCLCCLAATAALGRLRLVDIHGRLTDSAGRWRHCLHAILNLGGHGHKCLLYVRRILGARLQKRYAQMIRKFLIFTIYVFKTFYLRL